MPQRSLPRWSQFTVADPHKLEVTFIKPDGEMTIRMVESDTDSIVKAARALKAHHVVFQAYRPTPRPIWAVFEIVARQETFPQAIKTFVSDTSDAAVMWAVHRGRS